jgi:hypothetical protein
VASIVVVHGIWNLQDGVLPDDAATLIASRARSRLADGYAQASLGHMAVPGIVAAYYAHLLAPAESQGSIAEASWDGLSPQEAAWAWAWLRAAGVPEPTEAHNDGLLPLRQALGWLAGRRGLTAQRLGRLMAALLRELSWYTARPQRRQAVRDVVIQAVREHRPSVLIAHSLGSVVAYEALCAAADTKVELLVTLGSPLALAGGVFDILEPEPVGGLGTRPPGVERWVNLADRGDLVAVPPHLGHLFPVDTDVEVRLGALDFHSLGGYLGCGMTAAAIAPYCAPSDQTRDDTCDGR